jgi:hypothetical protein
MANIEAKMNFKPLVAEYQSYCTLWMFSEGKWNLSSYWYLALVLVKVQYTPNLIVGFLMKVLKYFLVSNMKN